MMMKQYYKMEQDLFGEIEKEKKFSFHKLMMLLALSSASRQAAPCNLSGGFSSRRN